MAKITQSKLNRARYKTLRTPTGSEIQTDKIGFVPPPGKVSEIVEYKGNRFVVWKDSPEQRISPRRAYERLVREANEEYAKSNTTGAKS